MSSHDHILAILFSVCFILGGLDRFLAKFVAKLIHGFDKRKLKIDFETVTII